MGAHQLVELHGVYGVVGVGTPGVDLEGLELAAIHERQLGGPAVLVFLAGGAPALRDPHDAGDLLEDRRHLLELGGVVDDNQQVARDAADLRAAAINRESRLHVAQETVLEDGAVAALEADFMVVDQADALEQRASLLWMLGLVCLERRLVVRDLAAGDLLHSEGERLAAGEFGDLAH